MRDHARGWVGAVYIQSTAYELRLTCVQGCVGERVLTSGEGVGRRRDTPPEPDPGFDTLSSRARECVVRVPGAAAETREQRGSAEEQQRWGLRGLWPWAVGGGQHPGQRVWRGVGCGGNTRLRPYHTHEKH